jgi:hypothetical protein
VTAVTATTSASIHLVARPADAGLPLTHRYVLEYYTPVLGPTCMALLGWVARHAQPGDPLPVDLLELGPRLGLRASIAPNAPLMRTIDRLNRYQIAAWNPAPGTADACRLLIADRLPPVPAHLSRR